ncbi:site-specific DNA-methyltransferase [Candidatus Kuenenbacteria bacterium]|nr:site-specific DNA-methyltransferase [Candidatus Kuenenbacteria bacterium]
MKIPEKWINTIQNIDCLDGFKKIPDNSVDLILTDPPYGISRELNCKNQRLGTTAKLNFDFGEWDKFNKKWFEIAIHKTKGWIISFCAKKDIGFYWNILEKNDFKAIDVIVWQKPDPIPLNGKTKMLNAWEAAIIGKKAGAHFAGKCQHNIFKYQAPKGKDRIHPTQKPTNLMEELIILTTKKGDLVLDPFMGSGTTAVACIKTGRNYIGFEIDKKYYKESLDRIKNTPRPLL